MRVLTTSESNSVSGGAIVNPWTVGGLVGLAQGLTREFSDSAPGVNLWRVGGSALAGAMGGGFGAAAKAAGAGLLGTGATGYVGWAHGNFAGNTAAAVAGGDISQQRERNADDPDINTERTNNEPTP